MTRERVTDAKWLLLAFTVTGLMVIGMSSCSMARATTLRIEEVVPTSTGIRPPPSASRYYDAAQPRILYRPGHAVGYLDHPAPATNCPGAFEVVSGPRSERGCYGGR